MQILYECHQINTNLEFFASKTSRFEQTCWIVLFWFSLFIHVDLWNLVNFKYGGCNIIIWILLRSHWHQILINSVKWNSKAKLEACKICCTLSNVNSHGGKMWISIRRLSKLLGCWRIKSQFLYSFIIAARTFHVKHEIGNRSVFHYVRQLIARIRNTKDWCLSLGT